MESVNQILDRLVVCFPFKDSLKSSNDTSFVLKTILKKARKFKAIFPNNFN
jgi:hypothetical protein